MSDHEVQGRKPGSGPPRLLDLAREAIRSHHYSYRTEETYLQWMKRFILFCGKRHSSVETTMIYTDVMNKGGRGVKSPLDHAD